VLEWGVFDQKSFFTLKPFQETTINSYHGTSTLPNRSSPETRTIPFNQNIRKATNSGQNTPWKFFKDRTPTLTLHSTTIATHDTKKKDETTFGIDIHTHTDSNSPSSEETEPVVGVIIVRTGGKLQKPSDRYQRQR
jgi:hypothetical protein